MRRTDILTGARAGETMYVLANGPSLDIEWMGWLAPWSCIGVNRLMIHGYVPGFMLIVDHEVWAERKDELIESDVIVIAGWDVYSQHPDEFPKGRTYVFKHSRDADHGAVSGDFFQGWLTGYYAAALAARMVYPHGRVVLAGMDLEYPGRGPTHSFGSGEQFGCHGKRFPDAVEAFVALKTALQGEVEFLVTGKSVLLKRGFSQVSR